MPDKDESYIILYTDGSWKFKEKIGGYAAYIPSTNTVICGNKEDTTNNQMELQAVISGLRNIEENSHVLVYTDSQYVTNAFNKNWINTWERNNWKRGNEDITNSSLWKELKEEVNKHKEVKFEWVKGHASTYGNNLCDAFATAVTKCYS